ncbi:MULTISPECIES: hypothetical protein [Streptomycetaceae]|uniref:Uncharacterized protein n=1 Tax=Streptantibioticus parmotrematis TaxID=2873249 RepID=A0ABS7R2P3_9ACTN|nr:MULTISPECIES: hypothetical protein [Streptomycetaceae]MBY8888825.1 hypothetical protein [Streptantibioticus parmotrematis]PWI44259.1 hypothetical protein CK485_19880 [Streptomyces sp. ICBB 8177]
MDGDGQLDLYARVAARLKQAHARVGAAQLPDDVRVALSRKLLVITAAAKHDAAGAAERLERFMRDFDQGRFPGQGTDQ